MNEGKWMERLRALVAGMERRFGRGVVTPLPTPAEGQDIAAPAGHVATGIAAVVSVTMRLVGASSVAAEIVRPSIVKFASAAAASATGLLNVTATCVESIHCTAAIAGGRWSPSGVITAWTAGNHASAILS